MDGQQTKLMTSLGPQRNLFESNRKMPVMFVRTILLRFHNRISEAVKAVIMIGMAVQIIIMPDQDYLALRVLNRYVAMFNIGLLFFVIGSARLAAIIANGTWKEYGIWMRSVGALLGALVWSQMFLSIVWVVPPDAVSLGGPIFAVFTIVELLSIYRAIGMRDSNGRDI